MKRKVIILIGITLLGFGLMAYFIHQYALQKQKHGIEETIKTNFDTKVDKYHDFDRLSPDGKWYFEYQSIEPDKIQIVIKSTQNKDYNREIIIPLLSEGYHLSWGKKNLLEVYYWDIDYIHCLKPELTMISYLDKTWQKPITYTIKEPVSKCYHFGRNYSNANSLILYSYNHNQQKLQVSNFSLDGIENYIKVIDVVVGDDYSYSVDTSGSKIIITAYEGKNTLYYVFDGEKLSKPIIQQGKFELIGIKPNSIDLVSLQKITNNDKTDISTINLNTGLVESGTSLVGTIYGYQPSENENIMLYRWRSNIGEIIGFWNWHQNKMIKRNDYPSFDLIHGWNDSLSSFFLINDSGKSIEAIFQKPN